MSSLLASKYPAIRDLVLQQLVAEHCTTGRRLLALELPTTMNPVFSSFSNSLANMPSMWVDEPSILQFPRVMEYLLDLDETVYHVYIPDDFVNEAKQSFHEDVRQTVGDVDMEAYKGYNYVTFLSDGVYCEDKREEVKQEVKVFRELMQRWNVRPAQPEYEDWLDDILTDVPFREAACKCQGGNRIMCDR